MTTVHPYLKTHVSSKFLKDEIINITVGRKNKLDKHLDFSILNNLIIFYLKKMSFKIVNGKSTEWKGEHIRFSTSKDYILVKDYKWILQNASSKISKNENNENFIKWTRYSYSHEYKRGSNTVVVPIFETNKYLSKILVDKKKSRTLFKTYRLPIKSYLQKKEREEDFEILYSATGKDQYNQGIIDNIKVCLYNKKKNSLYMRTIENIEKEQEQQRSIPSQMSNWRICKSELGVYGWDFWEKLQEKINAKVIEIQKEDDIIHITVGIKNKIK